MSESIVLREDQNGITQLTLNRPKKFNALSGEMMAALQTQFDDIAVDNSVRVVIIKANGKAFSAGHDLKEVRQSDEKSFHQKLFNQCGKMMLTINKLPQPVIAQVHGIATAAGCQLVANCDLAVASDSARFAVSGINFGLFCSTPAVPLSRNVPRKHALHMLLTGEFIDAKKACEYGLVNEVVEEARLNETALKMARAITNKPPEAIATGKEMFYRQLGMDLDAAYHYAAETMACNMDTDYAREGIDAFLEKREPSWRS